LLGSCTQNTDLVKRCGRALTTHSLTSKTIIIKKKTTKQLISFYPISFPHPAPPDEIKEERQSGSGGSKSPS